LESIYVATPINTLVSSSVAVYGGSTVTTYSTKISTDAAGSKHNVYYIATPLANDQSISYSYWNGNGEVTVSTYTTDGTTVKVVLEPYPSTTIHSVTTNVPSITAINTYSTAIETTNQNKKIATVLAFRGDFNFHISILNGLR